MRLLPLLALLVSLPLATGCHLGSKNSDLQASAKTRSKETWSKPKFARRESSDHAKDLAEHMLEGAHVAARSGRLGEARRLYGRVLDSDPRNFGAHHGLAILADREGDYGIAETHYLAALEERPRDPDLLNNVGYSYLQQDRYGEAKRLFVRVLEIEPGHQLATSNLGHVNAATGRFDEALELFRRVGTEKEARAEIAKYVGNGSAAPDAVADGQRLRIEAIPGRDDDIAGWSLEELQARREEARLAGIAARRRKKQIDYERLAAIDREGEPASEFDAQPEVVRGQPALEPNPFDTRGLEGTRDEEVRPVGFETANPRAPGGLLTFGPVSPEFVEDAPDSRVGGPVPDIDRGFDPPGGNRAIARDPAGVEFGAPEIGETREPGLWPADDPSRGPVASTAPPTSQPSGHRTLPPWPGTNDGMSDQPPSAAHSDNGGLVIRPSAIQQRAAILGLNAGSGLPIPIESASRTANRRAFDSPGIAPREPATPRGTAPAGWPRSEPTAPRGADRAAVAPEPWPGTAAQSVPKTTSMVPTDPSLYRAANGRPVGYERAAAPYGREGDANGRIEDWADARHDFDAEQAALAAERLEFRGGGAPRPDFPEGFGPPTTEPRTRRADGGW